MRALHLVGVAFATLRVVDTLKEGLPITMGAAVKSTASVAIAAALATPFAENWKEHLLLAGAAAGLASMLHDVQFAARMTADSYIAGITVAARRTTHLG